MNSNAWLPPTVAFASIVMFGVVYTLLFAVFLFLLNSKIQHGPDEADLRPTGKWAPRGAQGGAK